jgi:starch synthase
MRILMVCAEFAPIAKTGGLADATRGLSDALAIAGHDVRILLPRYRQEPPTSATCASVTCDGRARYLEIERRPRSPSVYLLDCEDLLADGEIYTGDERDATRFIRLCESALRFGEATGWNPEIVHCHDWHAAIVPVLLRARRNEGIDVPCRSVLTLHNIGYQGAFPARILADSGHADLSGLFDRQDVAHSGVNLLKAGIAYADALTTVSPTYAAEIQTPEYGMGLDRALSARKDDLTGILNGVDYRRWSPEHDPFIANRYSASNTAPKRRVKSRLCAKLGLTGGPHTPLLGLVSRLVEQKGIDLLIEAMPTLLRDTDCAFALLGAGEPALRDALLELSAKWPQRVAFRAGYDDALAHQIVAGSDLILMPSRYEPCGLTQLYALRYGTIPVVRATGGLTDTVQHFDPATGLGTGSVFEHADAQGLVWAIRCALEWLASPAAQRQLMANAMQADFSWDRQIHRYEAVYRRALRQGRGTRANLSARPP